MLRMIQVGLGRWGQDWSKYVLEPSDEVRLVAYADADAATLASARERLGLAPRMCFTSLAEALDAVQADAVLVTASLPGHVPLAEEALRAGKHVLLEKPFAPSVAQARALLDLACERGLVLMVSQNYRFYPAVRVVRNLLDSGELGEAGAISIDFRRYANSAPPEGNSHYTMADPLLADMSIHHFDLMRAILGQEAVEVDCHAWNPHWSRFRDPAAAFATVEFERGAMVSYRASWVSPGPATPWAGEWRIDCALGEISWTSRDNIGSGADRVTVRMLGRRPRRLEMPEMPYLGRSGSLHEFASATATGAEPESSGRENLGSIELTYAAIESARAGHAVRLSAAAPPGTPLNPPRKD